MYEKLFNLITKKELLIIKMFFTNLLYPTSKSGSFTMLAS